MRGKGWFAAVMALAAAALLCACSAQATRYTVSYEDGLEDVLTVPESGQYEAGEWFSVGNALVCEGKRFLGWEYGGQLYSAGELFFMPETDIVFTAKWREIVLHTIRFEGGGAEGEPLIWTREEGEMLSLPTNFFEREGYRFLGWAFDSELYPAGSLYFVPASDVTFVAQWEEKEPSFLLSFEGGEGAEGTMESIKVRAGGSLRLPDCSFGRQGYRFLGWAYEGRLLRAGEEFFMPGKDVTLQAVWEEILFTLTFEDGVSDAYIAVPDCLRLKEGEERTLGAPAGRTGYTFSHWTDGKRTFEEGEEFSMPGEDVILQAVWEIAAPYAEDDVKDFLQNGVSRTVYTGTHAVFEGEISGAQAGQHGIFVRLNGTQYRFCPDPAVHSGETQGVRVTAELWEEARYLAAFRSGTCIQRAEVSLAHGLLLCNISTTSNGEKISSVQYALPTAEDEISVTWTAEGVQAKSGELRFPTAPLEEAEDLAGVWTATQDGVSYRLTVGEGFPALAVFTIQEGENTEYFFTRLSPHDEGGYITEQGERLTGGQDVLTWTREGRAIALAWSPLEEMTLEKGAYYREARAHTEHFLTLTVEEEGVTLGETHMAGQTVGEFFIAETEEIQLVLKQTERGAEGLLGGQATSFLFGAPPALYSVQFGEETWYAEEGVPLGTYAPLPTAQREGYTFLGWFEEETHFDEETCVERDVVLHAKFDPIAPKIILDEGERELPSVWLEEEEMWEVTLPPAPPTLDSRFLFVRWEIRFGDACEYAPENGTVLLPAGAEATIRSCWQEIPTPRYVVTLDYGDGSEKVWHEYEEGTLIELERLTRTGYIFLGWFDGEVQAEFSYSVQKDVTLTAKWERKTPVVTAEIGDGLPSFSVENYEWAETGYNIYPPEVSEREGQRFLGWTATVNGVPTPFEAVLFVPLADEMIVHFTGHWVGRVTVTFSAGEHGSGEISPFELDEGEEFLLPDPPEGESGYAFAGWMSQEGIVSRAGSRQTAKAGAHYTAIWETAQYHVAEFDLNGGEFEDESLNGSLSLMGGKRGTLPEAPVQEGKVFLGWRSSYDGKLYAAESRFTMPNEDVVFTAEWQ